MKTKKFTVPTLEATHIIRDELITTSGMSSSSNPVSSMSSLSVSSAMSEPEPEPQPP